MDRSVPERRAWYTLAVLGAVYLALIPACMIRAARNGWQGTLSVLRRRGEMTQEALAFRIARALGARLEDVFSYREK
jgi:hypothetical protein